MAHPINGERVFVRPRHGLQVQRGDGIYQQFIAKDGQEVVWDSYLEARLQEGAIELAEAPVADSEVK